MSLKVKLESFSLPDIIFKIVKTSQIESNADS